MSPRAGHTTVIQRILEKRAERPPVGEDTTETVAVMVRTLPPPKALLVCRDPILRQQIERRITADMLEVESLDDEFEALRRQAAEFRPVIMTDSPEFIRKLRAQTPQRAPFVMYVAEHDESDEREEGLAAGADETLGRRASDREIDARIAAAKRISELEAVLRVTLTENRKLSATDDLTRVASRRFFSKQFPREVERAARYGRALAVILCDIDYFKKLNDTLGHAGGDQILRQFGKRLQQYLRARVDWVARIGGEEFAIVLPEVGYEQARAVGRKLRESVAERGFKVDGRDVRVTASFGLCGLDRVRAGERSLAQRMLKVADAALYRSKNDGRNRVTAAQLGTAAAEGTESAGRPGKIVSSAAGP
jgi:diguanylate cyclase (GGDEF)-like protein